MTLTKPISKAGKLKSFKWSYSLLTTVELCAAIMSWKLLQIRSFQCRGQIQQALNLQSRPYTVTEILLLDQYFCPLRKLQRHIQLPSKKSRNTHLNSISRTHVTDMIEIRGCWNHLEAPVGWTSSAISFAQREPPSWSRHLSSTTVYWAKIRQFTISLNNDGQKKRTHVDVNYWDKWRGACRWWHRKLRNLKDWEAELSSRSGFAASRRMRSQRRPYESHCTLINSLRNSLQKKFYHVY